MSSLTPFIPSFKASSIKVINLCTFNSSALKPNLLLVNTFMLYLYVLTIPDSIFSPVSWIQIADKILIFTKVGSECLSYLLYTFLTKYLACSMLR